MLVPARGLPMPRLGENGMLVRITVRVVIDGDEKVIEFGKQFNRLETPMLDAIMEVGKVLAGQ